MVLEALAETYDESVQRWNIARAIYVTRIRSRKWALNWALKKMERENPGFQEYSVKIVD